jgi:glycerol uptake facilitator-like aquaporin
LQFAGGVIGTVIAHLMFDLPPLMIGTTARSGPSQWLSEMVATFALVLTILGGVRYAAQAIPWLVGLVITAAYWFTSSTSFANPAVTLARGFTTTFAGIAINHVPAFILAQLVGAFVAVLLSVALFPAAKQRATELEENLWRQANKNWHARDLAGQSVSGIDRLRGYA